MKFDYILAPAIAGVTIALIQPQTAVALSSAEVAKLAKAIAVQIDNPNGSGSGVIIKKDGNTYTVLTARHVIDTEAKYEIVTPNGQRYRLDYNTVKKLPDVDLAVVQFTSNQNYPVAKLGNSDEATEGTSAYVAGFPQATAAISTSIYNFTDGRITANASKALKDGYALVYSNNTLPGMSGGPVLNEKGEVVGIHGRGDTTENFQISDSNPNIIIKSGFNLGIPINTFLRLSVKVGADIQVSLPSTPTTTAPKADDFFIQGVLKHQQADYKGAIAAYTEAIRLNSNYAAAYYNRGDSRFNVRDDDRLIVADFQKATDLFFAQGNKADGYRSKGAVRIVLKDYQQAITAFSETIKLNRNDALAYNERGRARAELGDLQGAIADFTQTIQINPKYIDAYNNRGQTRRNLGDLQGAIADLNKSLELAPNNAFAYLSRGITRHQLGEQQQAIADMQKAANLFLAQDNKVEAYQSQATISLISGDYQQAIALFTQAIQIAPKSSAVALYVDRGVTLSQVGDKQGAIADFNQVLKLNPNFAEAYNFRGIAKFELEDNQGAIADFNQTIKINPKNAVAYAYRGGARARLRDRQGAIADLQKAADLFREQGNINEYQKVVELLKQL